MTARTLPTSIATILATTCLAACGGSSNDPSTDDSPLPGSSSRSVPTDPETEVAPSPGLVDVGGRSVFLECRGNGSPTVILEAGLTGDTRTWELVAPKIAEESRVCAYDRANVGQSDPALTPRSAQDMVDDLDAALDAAGEQQPLVLVGFSFGGLVSQLYASSHPKDVAGIVLVESNHPDEVEVFHAHLTAAQVIEDRTAMMDNPERVDLIASFEQVQAAAELPSVPLVVVSAGLTDGWPPGWDPNVFDRLRARQQRDLAKSVPDGQQVIADHSGHHVPSEQPEIIIAAIQDVLATTS